MHCTNKKKNACYSYHFYINKCLIFVLLKMCFYYPYHFDAKFTPLCFNRSDSSFSKVALVPSIPETTYV